MVDIVMVARMLPRLKRNGVGNAMDDQGSVRVPVICSNGHENSGDAAFCARCGVALAAPALSTPDLQPAEAATTRTGIPRTLKIAGGAIVLVAILGAVAFALVPRGHTIRGTAALFPTSGSTNATGSWDSCSGSGGYGDLKSGGNVRITNPKGETIGGGFLQSITESDLAVLVDMDRSSGWYGLKSTDATAAKNELRTGLQTIASAGGCALWFEVEVSPTDIYGVEVTHRGVLDYPAAQLEKTGWVVAATLGK